MVHSCQSLHPPTHYLFPSISQCQVCAPSSKHLLVLGLRTFFQEFLSARFTPCFSLPSWSMGFIIRWVIWILIIPSSSSVSLGPSHPFLFFVIPFLKLPIYPRFILSCQICFCIIFIQLYQFYLFPSRFNIWNALPLFLPLILWEFEQSFFPRLPTF